MEKCSATIPSLYINSESILDMNSVPGRTSQVTDSCTSYLEIRINGTFSCDYVSITLQYLKNIYKSRNIQYLYREIYKQQLFLPLDYNFLSIRASHENQLTLSGQHTIFVS